jgi:hypothetical protein
MKYLLLLNNDVSEWEKWRTLTNEEAQEYRAGEIPKWNALFEWFGQQGIEVEGLELEDVDQARVIRTQGDGENLVSDGPFAETKEVIGGYFLADCKDLDQAIEIAERVPLVSRGSVEIRPLVTEE